MHDEEILECLKRIEHRLNSDEYEYGRFLTVGGSLPTQPAQTLYTIRSPYNTECEWCLYSCTSNVNRLTLSVGRNPAIIIPDLTGATTYGASGSSDNNVLEALVMILPANGTQTYTPVWTPLEGNGTLYAAMGSNATPTAAFATFAFRRKLHREIPFPPTRKAHTHSTVQSRRGDRTFSEGFEAQYPHDKYIHETVPETQDTANIGNVENMTPAQKVLAKLRNGGR